MKRVCLGAALTLAMTIMAACSNNGDNGGSPASPSPNPNPSATIRAIVVTGAPATVTTYKMTAKAEFTDGTSRDVTTQSLWTTSNGDIATIEPSGILTIRHSGQVEVRATFQNTTGAMMLTVNAPQPPPSGEFILSGTVHDSTADGAGLGGVVVRIVAGPNAGTSITTSADGKFGFLKVKGGDSVVEAQKDGYQVWRSTVTIDHDREIDIVLMKTTTQ